MAAPSIWNFALTTPAPGLIFCCPGPGRRAPSRTSSSRTTNPCTRVAQVLKKDQLCCNAARHSDRSRPGQISGVCAAAGSPKAEMRDMTDVVIASAARTPVGAFGGGLSSVPASYLGSAAIKEALKRAEVDPADVDEAILGQILTAVEPARTRLARRPWTPAFRTRRRPTRSISSVARACVRSPWDRKRSSSETLPSWWPAARSP